jgi:ABC-2 type transport system ATP-binding protein
LIIKNGLYQIKIARFVLVTNGAFVNHNLKSILLSLTNIIKRYGSHEVLDFSEWNVNKGIHWLKGGNGTGKSTLFRIISGQIPFKGEVQLNGVNLRREPVKFRSKISFAEAEPQYPLFIKGKELIDFYTETRKADRKQAKELADYFEMTPFLDNVVGSYSSGMLKKLSLICALIGDAELFILDEPLITIDVLSAEKLNKLITEKASQGKSFLISSHQEVSNDQLKIDQVYQIINKQIIQL